MKTGFSRFMGGKLGYFLQFCNAKKNWSRSHGIEFWVHTYSIKNWVCSLYEGKNYGIFLQLCNAKKTGRGRVEFSYGPTRTR